MEQYKIVLRGKPIALKRPRFSTINGKAFDSQKKIREGDKWEIASQWRISPLKYSISLELYYYIPIPSSWSKNNKLSHIGKPCLVTPDLDNYIKWSLDAMNGIVFDDDKQVYEIQATKMYSEEPRTEIVVKYESDVDEVGDG